MNNKEYKNMTLCKCGCGQEAKEGSEFRPGHYAKWKSQQKAEKEPKELKKSTENSTKPDAGLTITTDPNEKKKESLLSRLNKYRLIKYWMILMALMFVGITMYSFYNILLTLIKNFSFKYLVFEIIVFIWIFIALFILRLAYLNVRGALYLKPSKLISKDLILVDSPKKLLENLPAWAVDARKPLFVFNDPEKELVQVVLASERRKWRFIWVLWDPTELLLSIGKQAYKTKVGITSGVFLLNADTGNPIAISSSIDPEKETLESVHKEQIKNFYLSRGAAEARFLEESLRIVFILQVFSILILVLLSYLTYNGNESNHVIMQQILLNVSRIP